jgi:hypothetical protein
LAESECGEEEAGRLKSVEKSRRLADERASIFIIAKESRLTVSALWEKTTRFFFLGGGRTADQLCLETEEKYALRIQIGRIREGESDAQN